MTCGFCQYEFCWACGASATTADDHFGEFKGCGVHMMDDSIQPGDRGFHFTPQVVLEIVITAFTYIVLYPVVLVLLCPVLVGMKLESWATENQRITNTFYLFMFCVFGGLIGLVFINIVFIPVFLVGTIIHVVKLAIRMCILCGCMKQGTTEAEIENRRRAAERLTEREKLTDTDQ